VKIIIRWMKKALRCLIGLILRAILYNNLNSFKIIKLQIIVELRQTNTPKAGGAAYLKGPLPF
jgi:hypothetical protein